MALPKIDTPRFNGTIASSGEEVTFRPFKVKEEKILMLASEGGEYKDMVNACAQIVSNCVENLNAYELPIFDLQDLFIQIRSKSDGALANFKLTCGNDDCGESIPYEMDLTEFKMTGLDNRPNDVIQVSEDMIIKLKYPNAAMASVIDELDDAVLVAKCIEHVVDGEETINVEEEPIEDVVNFVEDLPIDTFKEIQSFFTNMPMMEHVVEYTCPKCEHDNRISINGYEHFFG
tara:strand:+ start:19077 stop:19772 length:696 start_codon:yes stop_codon:yes gene_type:complete